MRKVLKEFINKLDKQEYCDIMQATLEMGRLPKPKKSDPKTSTLELSEVYAINFFPTSTEGSRTYSYGPKWVLPVGETNKMSEFPSRSLVTEEMIAHWEMRMGVTQNVTLRARYADLVYDFLDISTEGRRKFQAARVFAESALELIDHGQTKYDNFRQTIKRGLYFAQILRDDELIALYIDKLLNLSSDNRYTDFIFRNLLLDKAIRLKLTSEQTAKILSDLEVYVKSILDGKNPQPFEINKIAGNLLKYYSLISDEVSSEKLAKAIEADYRKSVYSNSSGILKSNYLGEMREMYQLLAQTFAFAKAEVDRITAELASISSEIDADMQEIVIDHQFTKEETSQMEAFIDHLFLDDKSKQPRSMSDVIQRMIINFIPSVDDERISFEEATKQNPISYIFTESFIGEDGFNTATLKGLELDRERYFVKNYAQNLQFTSFLLRQALLRFIETFESDSFTDELLKSLVFRSEDKLYIERAVRAYWEKDYLPASQLFIPLIEDGFRSLHRVNGLPMIKPNEYGGYDYYSLDHFIDHTVINGVFSAIRGDDFQFYIKIILSNIGKMGWNLRHNFAHGINKTNLLRPDAADRLIHIILCLSLIRPNPGKKSDKT